MFRRMANRWSIPRATRGGTTQLWLAPVDRSSPARRIGDSGETRPHFGPRGQILFQATEGNFNYLEQMNPDGSGRSKVVPYPINTIQSISPGRRWVMARVPVLEGTGVGPWRFRSMVELRASYAPITVFRHGPPPESFWWFRSKRLRGPVPEEVWRFRLGPARTCPNFRPEVSSRWRKPV